MRAPPFIGSLHHTPSSAWAARPLASGARLVIIGRRDCSNVGLGCPSFGGQRTDRDGSSRLPAKVVTSPSPLQPATRREALSVAAKQPGWRPRSPYRVHFRRQVGCCSLPRPGHCTWPTSKDPSSQAWPNRQVPNARNLHTLASRHLAARLFPRCVGGVAFLSSPCSMSLA